MNAGAEKTPPRWRLTRRGFLIGAGTTAGVLAVGAYPIFKALIPTIVDAVDEELEEPAGHGPIAPLLWFALDSKKGITLFMPKGEMGQGVQTIAAQLAAEELEINPAQIQIVIANSNQDFTGQFSTFGSRATRDLYASIRPAAATLREMLRLEAAQQMKIAVDAVGVANGACFDRNNASKRLDYLAIVAAKSGAWIEQEKAAITKNREQFSLIGKPVARHDALEKVTGKIPFGISARAEGLLYGAVARAPRFGAVLRSGQWRGQRSGQGEKATALLGAQSGIKAVLIDIANNFAGVVADTRTRAQAALNMLELDWVGGSTMNQAELEARITAKSGDGTLVRSRGDLAQALNNNLLIAAYRTQAVAHAHLEPLAATVHYRADLIEAWVPTQSISLEVARLKAAFGEAQKVLVHGMQMGGSFGRKGFQSAVIEAARLSRAAGTPVSVAWTRAEEMRHSFYRNPAHSLMRGRVDNNGKIVALEHNVASADSTTQPRGRGFPEKALVSLYDIDGAAFTGLFHHYAIANYQAYIRAIDTPLPTGIWRGVALVANNFAIESFIDELAIEAKMDAIAFRLNNLAGTKSGLRLRRVLEEVRTKSDFATPAPSGIGRGVACAYFSNTAVAMVVETQIVGGAIIVTRVTAAVDAGLIVNPTGAKHQVVGSIVMGISSALSEKIEIENGAVAQQNFDTYPLLRLNQTPRQIDIHFIDSPLAPQGLGEAAIGPLAPAIAGAVQHLTGKRLRELPLRFA